MLPAVEMQILDGTLGQELHYSEGLKGRAYRRRIILADDHRVLLEGLRRILNNAGFEIVAEVEDGRALVLAAADLKPDLIITDFTMPTLNGLEASRQILRHSPKMKILMLSMHNNVTYAIEARNAGVRGYILKSTAAKLLIDTINKILDGEVYVDSSMIEALQTASHSSHGRDHTWDLTERQREVLHMLADGRPPKEIAGILGISARTVEFHKYRIMDILGLHSVPELAVYAVKKGII